MKIIRQPKPPMKEVECTCQECETVVSCEPKDFTYFSDQRDGDALKWQCPTCHRDNYVAVTVVGRAFARLVRQ